MCISDTKGYTTIIAKGFAKCITIILSWLVFNITLESFRIVYM